MIKKTKIVKYVPIGIESVTLHREGEHTCVYIEVKGKRHLIIRSRFDNWFYENITSEGIRAEIKKRKEEDERKKHAWRG